MTPHAPSLLTPQPLTDEFIAYAKQMDWPDWLIASWDQYYVHKPERRLDYVWATHMVNERVIAGRAPDSAVQLLALGFAARSTDARTDGCGFLEYVQAVLADGHWDHLPREYDYANDRKLWEHYYEGGVPASRHVLALVALGIEVEVVRAAMAAGIEPRHLAPQLVLRARVLGTHLAPLQDPQIRVAGLLSDVRLTPALRLVYVGAGLDISQVDEAEEERQKEGAPVGWFEQAVTEQALGLALRGESRLKRGWRYLEPPFRRVPLPSHEEQSYEEQSEE